MIVRDGEGPNPKYPGKLPRWAQASSLCTAAWAHLHQALLAGRLTAVRPLPAVDWPSYPATKLGDVVLKVAGGSQGNEVIRVRGDDLS